MFKFDLDRQSGLVFGWNRDFYIWFVILKYIRLALFSFVQRVSYKFYKYNEIYFSTLKALFYNKISLFFNNNYNIINFVIIMKKYL